MYYSGYSLSQPVESTSFFELKFWKEKKEFRGQADLHHLTHLSSCLDFGAVLRFSFHFLFDSLHLSSTCAILQLQNLGLPEKTPTLSEASFKYQTFKFVFGHVPTSRICSGTRQWALCVSEGTHQLNLRISWSTYMPMKSMDFERRGPILANKIKIVRKSKFLFWIFFDNLCSICFQIFFPTTFNLRILFPPLWRKIICSTTISVSFPECSILFWEYRDSATLIRYFPIRYWQGASLYICIFQLHKASFRVAGGILCEMQSGLVIINIDFFCESYYQHSMKW